MLIKNKLAFIVAFILFSKILTAQELQAKVTVLSNRVSNTTDRNLFPALQTAIANFINNRRWTGDTYNSSEKIICNFLINIESSTDPNTFKATLTVQAARPVYNASYLSPIINYKDADFTFRYIQFQALDFNENRVQGTDPLPANLTAVLAYYIYIILGMDYDSFGLKGGAPFFAKAQNIVNNAPEGSDIAGWRPFDGLRNRYWLADNLNNNRYNIIHDAFYTYFRKGLDKMYENEESARAEIIHALNYWNSFNIENPNTMVLPFFIQNRTQEFIQLFKTATPQQKQQAIELLQKIDIANAATYKQALK